MNEHGLFTFLSVFTVLYDLAYYDPSYLNRPSVTFSINNLNSRKVQKLFFHYDKIYYKISFAISKMEDIYTNRNGKADETHRHNYYTVLIIKKGKGQHKIDFNSYNLDKGQIYFVAPGQVHQVIEIEKSQGYVMTFSCDFLIENAIPLSFISISETGFGEESSPILGRTCIQDKPSSVLLYSPSVGRLSCKP